MTATAIAPAISERPQRTALAWAVSDTKTIAWRNLLTITRLPQLLIFSLVQPVIFVLMFRYVFGGAIKIESGSYVNYLMPGVFAQTVAFGAIQTGIGLAEDLHKGLIERFRSLPMAPSAVIVGVHENPGSLVSTMRIEMPLCFGASGSVRQASHT